MSVNAYSGKMYHLSKAVCLPERLDMPETMYELKPAFDLPLDIGNSYYKPQEYQTAYGNNSYGNDEIMNSITDVSKEFSEGIHNLESRQKTVLEKLQLFKRRLENLLENDFKSTGCQNISNAETDDIENVKEIVNTIDALKDHLIAKQLEKKKHALFCDNDLSEKWFDSLLKELCVFHKETENIAYKSENIQFLSHEDDLHERQKAILKIIDALALLMKSQISSQSSCLEDPTQLDIESYHSHVLKLVEVLQNELCKISKKYYEPQHAAMCNCNLSESDIYLKSMATSLSEMKLWTSPLESKIFLNNEFILKSNSIHDIVISANPLNPPYSIIAIKNILESNGLPVLLTSKIHSSIDQLPIDPKISRLFLAENNNERRIYNLAFTVLWKKQEMKSLMVSPISQSEIIGEANILRYISRLLPAISSLKYEMKGNISDVSQADYWLDTIQGKFLQGSNKERLSFVKQLNARLGTSQWIVGNLLGLADVFAWSVILQLNIKENLPNNAAKWFNNITKICGMSLG